MASTGLTLPTVAATSGPGTVPWTNPGNITADDNVYATIQPQLNPGVLTDRLLGIGYGFAIPSDNLILGIEVTIETGGIGSGAFNAQNVALTTDGSTAASFDESAGTTSGILVVGSPNDLWFMTLTPAIVNSPTFGASLVVDSGTWSGAYRCDRISINVYYGPTPALPSVDQSRFPKPILRR